MTNNAFSYAPVQVVYCMYPTPTCVDAGTLLFRPLDAQQYIMLVVVSFHWLTQTLCTFALVVVIKGGSRGVSKVSRNWSDHLWLVFACTNLIMSMLPYSYTFMCWKPVIKVSRSALGYYTRQLTVTTYTRHLLTCVDGHFLVPRVYMLYK